MTNLNHPAHSGLADHHAMAAPAHGMPKAIQRLPHLPMGKRCRIRAVGGGGAMRRRLMDLGVFPDAEITLLRVAPLNDPIEIRVGHSFVSLRRSEAELIEVVAL